MYITPAGRLCFPDSKLSSKYRTHFCSIGYNGVTNDDTNNNLAKALQRLTSVRDPGTDNEVVYRFNQLMWVANHMDWCSEIRASVEQYLQSWMGVEAEATLHYRDPHVKRQLRIAAYPDVYSRWFGQSQWCNKLSCKVKVEMLPPNKIPRLIGDFGVVASLQGFRCIEIFKNALADKLIPCGDGHVVFVSKPKFDILKTLYSDWLINFSGRFIFVCFSDDAVIGYRGATGLKYANIDISNCDGSHMDAMWRFFVLCFPVEMQLAACDLTMQCMKTFYIRSCRKTFTGRHGERVLLRPLRRILASGSTCTTAIDTIANFCIAKAISELDNIDSDGIVYAAAMVGYKVTIDPCQDYSGVQFLKTSPCWSNKGYIPVRNLGTFYRSFGKTLNGDLAGSGSMEQRGREFMAQYIQSCYPGVATPLLDMYRENFGTFSRDRIQQQVKSSYFDYVDLDTPDCHFVETVDFLQRYNLECFEQDFLFTHTQIKIGQHATHPVFEKLIQKDYGEYSCNYECEETVYRGPPAAPHGEI